MRLIFGMSEVDAVVAIQFCSDMHLEMPMETRRLGLHLSECLHMVEGSGDTTTEEGMLADTNLLPCNARLLALLGDIMVSSFPLHHIVVRDPQVARSLKSLNTSRMAGK